MYHIVCLVFAIGDMFIIIEFIRFLWKLHIYKHPRCELCENDACSYCKDKSNFILRRKYR